MKVIFIVKPIGVFRLNELRKILEVTFDDKKDSFHIYKSKRKGHSIELTQKALDENPDVVVACGGDGTINEVAQGLVDTTIALGILPLGSGNGIAGHHKIPFGFSKAIGLIKKNQPAKMDVGVVNGNYFFGNMGCALESHFIKHYHKNQWHGMWAYAIAFFNAIMDFKHQKIQIEYDQKTRQINPFIFLVSNTNQQGYDFSITPEAKSDDGQLNLFWMEKSNLFKKLKFMIYALLRRKLAASEFNSIKISTLKITLVDQDHSFVQIDGEFLPSSPKILEVKVLPKKLNIIIP